MLATLNECYIVVLNHFQKVHVCNDPSLKYDSVITVVTRKRRDKNMEKDRYPRRTRSRTREHSEKSDANDENKEGNKYYAYSLQFKPLNFSTSWLKLN